jgi:hypothetical protein
MAQGYKFEITPVDSGGSIESSTLVKGATKPEGVCHDIVVVASSAQIQGIFGYLALVDAGSNTSTVETAITALSP